MIGILLALQVNNWNENRKLKRTQITILKGIYSDLIKDTIDLNDNIRVQETSSINYDWSDSNRD